MLLSAYFSQLYQGLFLRTFSSHFFFNFSSGGVAIALGNEELLPDQVATKLLEDATTDVITDPGMGSPNKLLYIP